MTSGIKNTLKPIQFNNKIEPLEHPQYTQEITKPCPLEGGELQDWLDCFIQNAELFIPGLKKDTKKQLQALQNPWLPLGKSQLLYKIDQKKGTLEFLGPQEDEGVIAGLWGGYPIHTSYSIRNKSRLKKENMDLIDVHFYDDALQGKEALIRFFNCKPKGLVNPSKHPEAYSFRTTELFHPLRYLLSSSGILTAQEVCDGIDRMECLLMRDQLQNDPKILPDLLRMTHHLKEKNAITDDELHSIALIVKNTEGIAKNEEKSTGESAFITTTIERPDQTPSIKHDQAQKPIPSEPLKAPDEFKIAARPPAIPQEDLEKIKALLHSENDFLEGLKQLKSLIDTHGTTLDSAMTLPDPTDPIWIKICAFEKEKKLEAISLLLDCKTKIEEQPNHYLMTALFNYPATLLAAFPDTAPSKEQILSLYIEQFKIFALTIAHEGMAAADAKASMLTYKIIKELFDHIYPQKITFLAKLQRHKRFKDELAIKWNDRNVLYQLNSLSKNLINNKDEKVLEKLKSIQAHNSQIKRLKEIEKIYNKKFYKKTKKLKYSENLPEEVKSILEQDKGFYNIRFELTHGFISNLLNQFSCSSFEQLYQKITKTSENEGERIINELLEKLKREFNIKISLSNPKPLSQKALRKAMIETSSLSELEELLGPLGRGIISRYTGLFKIDAQRVKQPFFNEAHYLLKRQQNRLHLVAPNNYQRGGENSAFTQNYDTYFEFRKTKTIVNEEDKFSNALALMVDHPIDTFKSMKISKEIFKPGQIETLIELELNSPSRSQLLSKTTPDQLNHLIEKLKVSLVSLPPKLNRPHLKALLETYMLAILLKRNLEDRNCGLDLSRYKDYEDEFRETFTKEFQEILSTEDFQLIGESYFENIINPSHSFTLKDLPFAGMVDSIPEGYIEPFVHAKAIIRHEMTRAGIDLETVELNWDEEEKQIIIKHEDKELRSDISNLRKTINESEIISKKSVSPLSDLLAQQFQNLTGMSLSSFHVKREGDSWKIQATPYSISSQGVLFKGPLELIAPPQELMPLLKQKDCCFKNNETGLIEVIRQEQSVYLFDSDSKRLKRSSDEAFGTFHESGGIVWYPSNLNETPSIQLTPPLSFEFTLIQKEGEQEMYMESKEHPGYFLSKTPAFFKGINLADQIENSVLIQNRSGDQILITTLFDTTIEIFLKEGRLFCEDPWKLFAFTLEAKDERLIEQLSSHWNLSKPSTPFQNAVQEAISKHLMTPNPDQIRKLVQMVFADAAMRGEKSIIFSLDENAFTAWIDHYLMFIRDKGAGGDLPREQERFFLTQIKKRYYKHHGKARLYSPKVEEIRSRHYFKRIEPALNARLKQLKLDSNLSEKDQTRIIKPIPYIPEIDREEQKQLLENLINYHPKSKMMIQLDEILLTEESLKNNFAALYMLAREGSHSQREELLKRLDLMKDHTALAKWFTHVAKHPGRYIKLKKLHKYKSKYEKYKKAGVHESNYKLHTLTVKLSHGSTLFRYPALNLNPLIKKALKSSKAKLSKPFSHLKYISYTSPMTAFKASHKSNIPLEDILNEIDPFFDGLCEKLKEKIPSTTEIENAIEEAREALLNREVELIALANHPESDFAFLERQRIGRSLEWPDIIDLVRKNKEYAYSKHLGTPQLTNQLIQGVYEYLAVRSRYFQLIRAQNAISENKQDRAQEILSAKRAYKGESLEDLDFLFLEASTPKGLYREDQYKKILNISKQNISLAKMETGWGKSDFAIPKLNESDQTVFMPNEVSPRLYLRRGAGQIKRLVLNIWPGAILRKGKEDLAKKIGSATGKPLYELHFSRSQQLDATQLEIMAIQLEKAAKKGIPISLRAEDIAALNLHFIEALEKGDDTDTITQFIRILKLIHEVAFATIDEAHLVLDPMQKTIYAMGKKLSCPPSSIQSAIEIFDILLNSKKFSEILKNNSQLTTKECEKARNEIFDDEICTKLAAYAGVSDDYSLFKEYIKGGKCAPKVSNEDVTKLHLIKGYYLSILPATLSGAVNVQFGLSKDFYKQCKFAIPYIKKDMPKESLLSEGPSTYQNADETLFKTLRTYHTVGLTNDNLADLFNFYFEQSKSSAIDDAAEGFAKIEELCKKYPSLHENRIALTTMNSGDRQLFLKNLVQAENIPLMDKEWIAPFIKHCVAPQITTYQNTLEITPQDIILMLEKSVSLSATPQEARIHSPRTVFFDTESSDDKLLNTLKTKMEKISPLPMSKNEFAQSIILACKGKTRAVADPSGLSELNRPFVEYLAEQMKADKENCIQYILYFDLEENQFMRFRILDGSISPYNEAEQLAQLDSTLTLYDQARSTGTDIPQKSDASLILIASTMSGLGEVGQAVGRMREIHREQSFEVWISGKLEEVDPLLKKWKANENAFKAEKNKVAIEQLMEAEIKVAMIRQLIGLPVKHGQKKAGKNKHNAKHAIRLFKDYREALIRTTSLDPDENYGSIGAPEKVTDILNRKQESALKMCKHYFKGQTRKSITEQLRKYNSLWEKDSGVSLPKKTIDFQLGSSQELSMEKEVAAEIKIEQDSSSFFRRTYYHSSKARKWPSQIEKIEFRGRWHTIQTRIPSTIRFFSIRKGLKSGLPSKYKKISNFFSKEMLASTNAFNSQSAFSDAYLFSRSWKPINSVLLVEEIVNGKKSYKAVAIDEKDEEQLHSLMNHSSGDKKVKLALYNLSLGAIVDGSPGAVESDLLKQTKIRELIAEAKLLAGKTEYTRAEQEILKKKAASLGGHKGEELLIQFLKERAPLNEQTSNDPKTFLATCLGFI